MVITHWQYIWRLLKKYRAYTLLNIFGLSTAFASCIIIFLYARHELGFDAFHANAERIQLVYKERHTAQGIVELDDTWFPLSSLIEGQYPEVMHSVRITRQGGRWVSIGDRKFNETLTYADPSFFQVFSFPLAQGDPTTALDGRNAMVLSRATAEKYFGSEDPIGRTVTVNFNEDYLITGVLEEIPSNSSLQPEVLVPLVSRIPEQQLEAMNSNWGASFLQTFLLLDRADAAQALQQQFPSLVLNTFGEEGANGSNNMQLKLWSLRSYHDRNVNSDGNSYLLLAIACAIILMACINMINLSIARSLDRTREVGMRKVLGAERRQLFGQFLSESLLTAALSLVLGLGLASLLLPVFNGFYDLSLAIDLARDPLLSATLLTAGLGAGLIAGSYPAWLLSRAALAAALKEEIKSSSGGTLRAGLSFLQFTLAITLTAGMVVIWQQNRFMKDHELNFDQEQVLVVPLRLADFADQEAALTRLTTFKERVLSIPSVRSVASSMSVPGNYVNSNTFARPEDWQRDEPLRMLVAAADDGYFETYGMRFIEGRNFSREYATEGDAIILNETAMRDMGWDSAVGKRVNDWTVVGVVEDFHYQSLSEDIAAIIHIYAAQDSGNHRFISLKLDGNNIASTLASLETEWRLLDPSRALDYYFVDEDFANLYRSIDNTNTIIAYFTLLSIIIANLGALGLASYALVRRSREIGMRKVLGGGTGRITMALTASFLKPALLANLLAWPLAYLATNQWLQGFAYAMDLNILIFPLSGIAIVALAMAVIATQAVRIANTNPALTLRSE